MLSGGSSLNSGNGNSRKGKYRGKSGRDNGRGNRRVNGQNTNNKR